MPYAKRRRAIADDTWRTAAQFAEDKALRGTWWRCRVHGLTTSPLMLGEHAYCGEPDCPSNTTLLLVHTVSDDPKGTPERWNQGPRLVKRNTPRVETGDDVGAFAPPERDEPDAPTGDDTLDASEPEPEALVDTSQEETMPTETTDDPRSGAELILTALLATRGVPTPRGVLVEMVRKAKPSASRTLADQALGALKRRGHIEGDAAGYSITDAGAAIAQVNGAHGSTEVERRRRKSSDADAPPRKPRKKADSPAPFEPAAPEQSRQEAEIPADDEPLGHHDFVPVRLTPAMRARLEQRLAEGFSGHSLGEVAERFLARALLSFTAGGA